MTSHSPRPRAWLGALLLAVALVQPALAQLGGGAMPEPGQLLHVTAKPVTIAAGGAAEASFALEIANGWHINANPPSPDYMIPTELALKAGHGITPGKPAYPLPQKVKVGFEDSELSVLTGQATLRLPLAAAGTAAAGKYQLAGTIRFQACNDQVCMAPASVPVTLEVTVTGGGAATPAPPSGTQAPPPSSDVGEPHLSSLDSAQRAAALPPTTPDGPSGKLRTIPGAATPNNFLARLDQATQQGGGPLFLLLFLGGLALNLTPCVFPMLGVTVSLFGARRKEPMPRVFANAATYVLGICVMYTTLGVIAALTGKLFGAALQNPMVSVGLGLLMVVLSLSMFGVYELQPPSWLLTRVGGANTASIVGLFFSGLAVGVIAAPCVGPFVVAVLALVAQRGDVAFGARTLFTLSLGLGVPYLVLAMFSNLIQALPRSGDWMVWVKKVFGVLLLSLGVFYALLAFRPSWAVWVPVIALILGGAYLGFFEKSSNHKVVFRWIKRLAGGVAVVAGAVMVITAPTTTEGITFSPFSPDSLQAALASGQPAMLDFSADWCAPCHELERFTFTDKRVRERARAFRNFHVDLTTYDSPEAEQWRRQYAIAGVPTVIFITPDGAEVPGTRVEGFLPPEMFLKRMAMVTPNGSRAARE